MNAKDIAALDRFSYRRLRGGIAVFAAVCPVVILLWGMGVGPIRGSLSEYYYAGYSCSISSPNNVDRCYFLGNLLRDFFVGGFCVIGALLIQYKGYSKRENWALNLAGIVAICIALSPTQIGAGGLPLSGWPTALHGKIHLISLPCFVLLIAYVAIICSETTLTAIVSQRDQNRYRLIYRLIGTEMICMPIIVVILSLSRATSSFYIMLVLEVICIWTFAGFWLIKSDEIATIESQLTSCGAEGA